MEGASSDKQDEQKLRWAEIELKMKFKTCDEAETFWQDDWTSCPVCGAHIELVDALTSDEVFVPVHRNPDFIRN